MLNVQSLASEILTIMTDMRTRTEIDDSEFANRLAQAIHSFVLDAEVQPGIPVSTTGSASAQTGTTTGTGKLL